MKIAKSLSWQIFIFILFLFVLTPYRTYANGPGWHSSCSTDVNIEYRTAPQLRQKERRVVKRVHTMRRRKVGGKRATGVAHIKIALRGMEGMRQGAKERSKHINGHKQCAETPLQHPVTQ